MEQGKLIIGSQTGLAKVIPSIEKIAATSTPVLIVGEIGTGRNFFANEVHLSSQFQNGPFVKLFCKGGQVSSHAIEEAFSNAKGGSLFLDDVGELDQMPQKKLLDLLRQNRHPNVRVVASSDYRLYEYVGTGKFLQDLFYELHIAKVVLPPLRERLVDIPHFLCHFLRTYNQMMHRQVKISEGAIRYLRKYSWPGNIRELENMVQSMVSQSAPDHCILEGELSHFLPQRNISSPKSVFEEVREQRRQKYRQLLLQAEGNVSLAARNLGVPRTTFRRHLKKLGLTG